MLTPIGGHVVYLDAGALLPHIPLLEYPGQALALYLAGGVCSREIRTVMFGRRPDGTEVPATLDLVRLVKPRRTYAQSHIQDVSEVWERMAKNAADLSGYRRCASSPLPSSRLAGDRVMFPTIKV